MKIPSLSARFYLLATVFVSIVAAIVAISLAIKSHDRRVAEQAAARARITRDSAFIASMQKRLKQQDSAVVHAIGDAVHAIEHYKTIRLPGRVDTVRIKLPGRVDSVTIEAVPLGTTAAADTAIKQCEILRNSCAAFRITADSTIAAQARIIEEQRHLKAAKGSRFSLGAFSGVCTDRRPCAGVGLNVTIIRF